MKGLKFGILTVSDSCYKNENVDRSGPRLVSLIKAKFADASIEFQEVVPDEIPMIKDKLTQWSDKKCHVIITTGGTGFAPRDRTPEATRDVIEREAPGLVHLMMSKSLAITKFAVYSRAVCGIRVQSLIINLPGSERAVVEHFETVADVIPHAVCLIHNDLPTVTSTHRHLHDSVQNTMTPSKVKLGAVASRSRHSPYPLVEVDQALAIITSVCVQEADTDTMQVSSALGHVLAEDVRAFDPLPPFPASIKDGYAVRSVDGPGKRTVCDAVAAGDNPEMQALKAGQCVRISTGAPVPPGADAVVQVEDTELLLASADNSRELEISIKVRPTVGQDIRRVGSDMEAHSVVIHKGTVLNAAEIGVLAAVGRSVVRVYKRMTLGIISTGNEVQDPSVPLQAGRIRDTNKITLMTLLTQHGYHAEDCGVARDEPTLVKHTLQKAFAKCDLVITSGGVSMGEHDVLKQVLVQDFNAVIHFGRVNMKPGKPTTFATCAYNDKIKTVFALPGNPVSATVTCLLFVIPALRHCENRADKFYPKIPVVPACSPNPDPARPDYQRVWLEFKDGQILAHSTGNQISSRLNSFVGADGLMLVPPQPPKKAPTLVAHNSLFSSPPTRSRVGFGGISSPVTISTQTHETKKDPEPFVFDGEQKPKYWCYLLKKY
ncbi:cinnamon [Carabus blaptoides fortunei]